MRDLDCPYLTCMNVNRCSMGKVLHPLTRDGSINYRIWPDERRRSCYNLATRRLKMNEARASALKT